MYKSIDNTPKIKYNIIVRRARPERTEEQNMEGGHKCDRKNRKRRH